MPPIAAAHIPLFSVPLLRMIGMLISQMYMAGKIFMLRSRENKEHYLACQIAENLCNAGMPVGYALHTVNGLFKKEIIKDNDNDYDYGFGIDHQSVIALPMRHPCGLYGDFSKMN